MGIFSKKSSENSEIGIFIHFLRENSEMGIFSAKFIQIFRNGNFCFADILPNKKTGCCSKCKNFLLQPVFVLFLFFMQKRIRGFACYYCLC